MDGRAKLHLANLWRWKCGLKEHPMPEEDTEAVADLAVLRESQWCPKFESLMRARLVMGSFRYGLLSRKSGLAFDSVGSAMERLILYKQTGNQEHLVDAANLCLVEFLSESHPLAHMEAIDDGVHAKEVG